MFKREDNFRFYCKGHVKATETPKMFLLERLVFHLLLKPLGYVVKEYWET